MVAGILNCALPPLVRSACAAARSSNFPKCDAADILPGVALQPSNGSTPKKGKGGGWRAVARLRLTSMGHLPKLTPDVPCQPTAMPRRSPLEPLFPNANG